MAVIVLKTSVSVKLKYSHILYEKVKKVGNKGGLQEKDQEKLKETPEHREERKTMMQKIFHTGDIHLGMTYRNRGYPEELRKELVEARFQTLAGMVKQANREKCALFLVAGDLFHRTNVPREMILRAVEILGAFEGNCVAVLPGNHDYRDEFSTLWKSFRELAPDNVLLLEQMTPYNLGEYNLEMTLLPAPCHSKHSGGNNLGWIRELDTLPEGGVRLGVAHGSVKGVSPDFDGRYYPMETGELAELPVHHWCLGHTHITYPDQAVSTDISFTYCGTPEPDGFDCTHRGFARITTLDQSGNMESRAVVTGRFSFSELHQEIKGWDDLIALEHKLEGSAGDTLLKLVLSGTLPRDEYSVRTEVLDRLRALTAYLELDEAALEVEITSRTIDEEFARGSFPYLLLSRLAAKGENEALQEAYQLVRKVST